MIKKILVWLLILSTGLSLLSIGGCSPADDGKITVVCSVFPIYNWTKNIVGDSENVEVRLLVKNGSDPHSYQATAEDVMTVKNAELMLRVGGVSDGFIEELMKDADNVRDIRLMEAEGVTVRHASKETHVHEGEEHDHPDDEHIWLSLKNASACVSAITDALSELFPEEAEKFQANEAGYVEALRQLDLRYAEAVGKCADPKIIFADRFPFAYVTEDYGIRYLAAFEGCSTESDASFDTILQLTNTLDLWDIDYLCVTESSDGRLAEMVIENSAKKSAEIVVFDSMQTVDSKEINSGATYLGIMERNLIALCRALDVEE